MSKLRHAWALTIHKFQGSEADTVVYGVSSSKNETWKHVYTAITRAKKNIVIVGLWEDLRNAIQRKPFPRQTYLKEKIRLGLEMELDDSFGVQMSQMSDIAFSQIVEKPASCSSDSSTSTISRKRHLSSAAEDNDPFNDSTDSMDLLLSQVDLSTAPSPIKSPKK
jgi:hypothetical protein